MKRKNEWETYFTIDGKTGGGNADVFFVTDKSTDRKFALKELRYKTIKGKKYYRKESRDRFISEITIAKNNAHIIPGIIPIDYSCDREFWYVMPIAEHIMKHIDAAKIEEIILGVVQLAETLEKLHDKKISHRDIKPANIFYYKNRFSLGDFGLVDFPDNFKDNTRSDRGLGAIFTIAPEMKRNPKDADGKKADVFSLAKTMWMFLSKDEKGFDGVYNHLDSSHSLRYIKNYTETYLVDIEELLRDSTNNNPEIRPTMREFKEKLKKWLDIYHDLHKSQASDWNFLNEQIFGLYPPESSSWNRVDSIIEILNIIGKTSAYNHMLLPGQGGLDFSHAEISSEDNCIKIYDTLGYCHVVKPKVLYFEGFNENYKWNYFLLELDNLEPILEENSNSHYEYLVEDRPGNYVSAEHAQYGVYDYDIGNPLPIGFQTVHRYVGGKFLIVMKYGPYNGINSTYDGRHGNCDAEYFRGYITDLISAYSKLKEQANQVKELEHLSEEEIDRKIFSLKTFNINPFERDNLNEDENKKIQRGIYEKEKSMKYINENYYKWNFETMLNDHKFTCLAKIKFAFIFNKQGDLFSIGKYSVDKYYISNYGYIKKSNSEIEDERYFVFDRNLAIKLKDALNKQINKFLKENKLYQLEKHMNLFSIEPIKCGEPIHLFSKNEIKEEMRKADDRVNNQLVIDEYGYVKIINHRSSGRLYPVRLEQWTANNIIVGKYSNLFTLNDNYISSLQGWLLYLKTGNKQYMDYVHENIDEEQIIKEIKEYYY